MVMKRRFFLLHTNIGGGGAWAWQKGGKFSSRIYNIEGCDKYMYQNMCHCTIHYKLRFFPYVDFLAYILASKSLCCGRRRRSVDASSSRALSLLLLMLMMMLILFLWRILGRLHNDLFIIFSNLIMFIHIPENTPCRCTFSIKFVVR